MKRTPRWITSRSSTRVVKSDDTAGFPNSFYQILESIKTGGGGWLRFSGSGQDVDFVKQAGEPWDNGAVSAVLGWLQRNFSEPRLYVAERSDEPNETPKPIENHPATEFLRTFGIGGKRKEVLDGVVLSLSKGNAYVWKRRDGFGRLLRLEYLSHEQVEPEFDWTPTPVILRYWYSCPRGRVEIPIEDMIHIRYGIDPKCSVMGLGWANQVAGEIAIDRQATKYHVGLMNNGGQPSVIFKPKDAQSPVDAPGLGAQLRDGGLRNAGRALVTDQPVDAQLLGWSPDQMAVEKIRDVPEARICAGPGVAPMTVGLSSGARQRTYNNQAEAERSSQLNGLVPQQKLVSNAFTDGLLLELGGDPTKQIITWEWESVQSLSAITAETHQIAREDYKAGVSTLNEARERIGLPEVPDGDRFITDTTEPQGAGVDGNTQTTTTDPSATEDDDTEDTDPEDPSEDDDTDTTDKSTTTTTPDTTTGRVVRSEGGFPGRVVGWY